MLLCLTSPGCYGTACLAPPRLTLGFHQLASTAESPKLSYTRTLRVRWTFHWRIWHEQTRQATHAAAAGFKLEAPPDLEPHIAEALSARRCLPLLAALVHVPAMHATQLADNAQYGGATTSAGVQVSWPWHVCMSVTEGCARLPSIAVWGARACLRRCPQL